MNDITTKEHKDAAAKIRNLLAVYQKNADLINIGAYVKGTDPNIDKALEMNEIINEFLIQSTEEDCPFDQTVSRLIEIANM